MEGLKKIKELIANDATEESLDELGVMTAEKSYEIQNAIIQLRRRLKDIKRAEASGTLSYQEISQEKGKINEAILDLLHELEGESKKAAPARQVPVAAYTPPAQTTSAPPSSGMNQKKVLMIAGAAIALIALIAIISSPSDSNESQNGVEFNQQQQAAPDDGQAPTDGGNQQEFIDETAAPEESTPAGTFDEDQSTQQQQEQFEFDTATAVQDQIKQ